MLSVSRHSPYPPAAETRRQHAHPRVVSRWDRALVASLLSGGIPPGWSGARRAHHVAIPCIAPLLGEPSLVAVLEQDRVCLKAWGWQRATPRDAFTSTTLAWAHFCAGGDWTRREGSVAAEDAAEMAAEWACLDRHIGDQRGRERPWGCACQSRRLEADADMLKRWPTIAEEEGRARRQGRWSAASIVRSGWSGQASPHSPRGPFAPSASMASWTSGRGIATGIGGLVRGCGDRDLGPRDARRTRARHMARDPRRDACLPRPQARIGL